MIENAAQLAGLLPLVKAARWVALDTEADSLHAYPEKLCLVQLSLPGHDELVDPLTGLRLDPLLDALARKRLILHGADYDLRLLYSACGFVPEMVFDTMWAARLVGRDRFGLGDLAAHYLGVTLEKGPQKANWARRPLTARMETYALNDTRHLKPLSDLLEAELVRLGRLGWFEQCCARQVSECARPRLRDAETVWRIKGSDRLGRVGLAFLRELWHWREQEAVRSNLPPYFVLSHEVVAAVARYAEQNQAWEGILPPRLSGRRREAIQQAVERARALPSSQLPHRARQSSHRMGGTERRLYEELQRRRDRHAQELRLDPTLIASRGTLVELAVEPERVQRELMPWQRALLMDAPSPI